MSPAVESPTGQPLAAWLRIAIAFVGLLVGAAVLVIGIGMLSADNPADTPTTVTVPAAPATSTPPPVPATR